MADRETVITHLQIIHTWASFAREHDLQFFTAKHLEDIAKWADDAIAMLKEQENDIHHMGLIIEEYEKELKKQEAVIRCKDCKYYRYYGLANDTVSECTINHCENPDGDWFCADGERKDI